MFMKVRRLISFSLALIPCVFLGYWIVRLAIDMPYQDAWDLVPFLQKYYSGQITIGDWLANHNESRIPFLRLLVVINARVLGWSVNFELFCLMLLYAVVFAILIIRADYVCRRCIGGMPLWLPLIISALLFSMLQYESWTFGFTIIGAMNYLAAVIGLMVLSHPCLTWRSYLIAALAGVVALYSYVNGILYFAAALLPMLAGMRASRRYRIMPLVAWLCFAAVLAASFFTDAESVFNKKIFRMPPLEYYVSNLNLFFGYFFALLGNGVANTPSLPDWGVVSVGVFGCVLFVTVAVWALAQLPEHFCILSFWVALGSYMMMTAMSVAVGRCYWSGGIQQSLYSSRYAIISSTFWICTSVITIVALRSSCHESRATIWRRCLPVVKVILTMFLLAGASIFCFSSARALQYWISQQKMLRPVRDELLCDVRDQAILAHSFWNLDRLEEYIDFLSLHKLAVFREKKAFQNYQIVSRDAGCIEKVFYNTPPMDGLPSNIIHLEGIAFDAGARQSAQGVILVNDDGFIVENVPVKPADNFKDSRWKLAVTSAKLPPNPQKLRVYAILRNGRQITLLGEVEAYLPASVNQIKIDRIVFENAPALISGCSDMISVAADQVYAVGWVRNPATGRPPGWILITDSATNILGYASVTDSRPDIARTWKALAMAKSGWRLALNKQRFSPGKHVLMAWGFLPEEYRAWKISKEFEIFIQ